MIHNHLPQILKPPNGNNSKHTSSSINLLLTQASDTGVLFSIGSQCLSFASRTSQRNGSGTRVYDFSWSFEEMCENHQLIKVNHASCHSSTFFPYVIASARSLKYFLIEFLNLPKIMV